MSKGLERSIDQYSHWVLINGKEARQENSHFVFTKGDDVAIADHSIGKMTDPSSTEDGLLLWDGKVGKIYRGLIEIGISEGRGSYIHVTPLTAYRIQQATGKQVIPD